MKSSKIAKNKKTENNSNRIILNSITDLLKIQIHKLNNFNLENISGIYFDKIYQEAIKSENQLIKESNNSQNKINKSKKNNKSIKIKKNIDDNPNSMGKKKQKYNLNENNFNNQNDFYIEEFELPESDQEKSNPISNSQNNVEINYKKLNINNRNNDIKDNNRKKKIKYMKINKENNNNYNTTPFSNEEKHAYIFGQTETPDIIDENEDNNYYINNNLYIPTPTPIPNEEEDKKDTVIYPLNKIIFSIIYNSIFGEEVCILGSSPNLGLWNLNGALHLKWNEGNLWKGEINIEVQNLQDFEFKYVITEKGKIKYWETGENNIVNFTGLINEFQFKNNGSYNKYDYEYKPNEGSLLIKSKWYK